MLFESKAHNEAADAEERVANDEDPRPYGKEVLRSGHGNTKVCVLGCCYGIGSEGNSSGVNTIEINLSDVVSRGDSSSCRPGFAGSDNDPDEVGGLGATDGSHTNG
jgi:hypothetical protein